jgi:putative redox protein
MDKHKITTTWEGGLAFDTQIDNHTIRLDAPESMGGGGTGPGPKKMMLLALSGCTGMDVVLILKKMRVVIDKMEIEVEADLTKLHPKHYTKMHVIYTFYGKDLPLEKIQKAVKLSEDTYCGVRAVYAKTMEMSSEVRIV